MLQVAPSVARGQRRHPPRRGPRLRVTHSRAPSPSPAPPRPHRTIGPSPELLRRPGPPSHGTETRRDTLPGQPTRTSWMRLGPTVTLRPLDSEDLSRILRSRSVVRGGKGPGTAVGRRTASEEQTCALTRGRDCFRVDTSDVWSSAASPSRAVGTPHHGPTLARIHVADYRLRHRRDDRDNVGTQATVTPAIL